MTGGPEPQRYQITGRQRRLLRTIIRGHPVSWPDDGIPTCRGRAVNPIDVEVLEREHLIKALPYGIRGRRLALKGATLTATGKGVEEGRRC